jgi:hypothetical protein
MYKPLFLGINDADPWIIYPILIFLALGLLLIAGIIAYYAGIYILKIITWTWKHLIPSKR